MGRHLAAIWKNTPYEFRGVQGNTLDRIDIFMLLDLLGARNPNINSSQRLTEPWFKRLMQIEDGITEKRIFPSRLRKIFKQTAFPSSVEDDHKPFEKQDICLDRDLPLMMWIMIRPPKKECSYPTCHIYPISRRVAHGRRRCLSRSSSNSGKT